MKHKIHGFTLIELLVVIALIGIILSIAIPGFSSLNTTKSSLSYSSVHFMKDILHARNYAMLNRCNLYFILDPNSRNRYTFFSKTTPGDQPGKPTARQIFPWIELGSGIYFCDNHFTNNFVGIETVLPTISISTNIVQNSGNTNYVEYPYFQFDSFGKLVQANVAGKIIDPRGFFVVGLTMKSKIADDDIVETPVGNRRFFKINEYIHSELMGDFVFNTKIGGDE